VFLSVILLIAASAWKGGVSPKEQGNGFKGFSLCAVVCFAINWVVISPGISFFIYNLLAIILACVIAVKAEKPAARSEDDGLKSIPVVPDADVEYLEKQEQTDRRPSAASTEANSETEKDLEAGEGNFSGETGAEELPPPPKENTLVDPAGVDQPPKENASEDQTGVDFPPPPKENTLVK